MAATLTGFTAQLNIALSVTAEKALDLSTPKEVLTYNKSYTYAFGAGALQCNCFWHDSRTIALGSSETLDLAGVLTDAFGSTVQFANVKLLIIENISTAGQGTLNVGNAVATQFASWLGGVTQHVVIIAGEAKVLIARNDADGYVSTGGASDNLKITNADGGNSATYKIIIAGDSA